MCSTFLYHAQALIPSVLVYSFVFRALLWIRAAAHTKSRSKHGRGFPKEECLTPCDFLSPSKLKKCLPRIAASSIICSSNRYRPVRIYYKKTLTACFVFSDKNNQAQKTRPCTYLLVFSPKYFLALSCSILPPSAFLVPLCT